MSVRAWMVLLLVSPLLVPEAHAKNKKKQVLAEDVLRAENVLVVIHPEAGEPLTNLGANRTAQEDVEKALLKWGRFKLVMDAQTADLVIAVRKGHANGPTIRNLPTDDRAVIAQQTDAQIRIGGKQGHPTDLTDPQFSGPEPKRPRMANEVGPSEDIFEVYRGGVKYPLDKSPVWRYMAKDALNGPEVEAVEQFRKAIAESEVARQQKN
jgi:non-ribosomal peptide synthetase component F